MFKIIYDLSKNDRNIWLEQFKTKEYPNFTIIETSTIQLEIGTVFILKDNEGSYWHGEWSVGLKNGYDSYRIRKIINIDDFINGNKRYIEYIADSIFNSEFHYAFDLKSRYNKCDILEYDKFDVYKLPNSEIPREWLMSTTYHGYNRERDIQYLTNIYLNIDSKDLTDYKCRYNKCNNLSKFDNILSLKRDIIFNKILNECI